MNKKQIMTPKHPLWKQFINRLAGPEGCNFQQDKGGSWSWKCKGGNDKSFATAILKTMDNIDIESSLEYFESKGGYCDCEILFNIIK
jgi:hypothetical protein